MSRIFQRTEAIILRVVPYRDYDSILTLFTLNAGIIKILYKGCRSRRKGMQGICHPLTKVEVVYVERNSEIFNCQEMALLEPYHFLRGDLIHLEVACDLLRTISYSQLGNKPAPYLYQLLHFYIERIPHISDPWVLAVSFRLKLLLHEGLSSFPFNCSVCSQPIFEAVYGVIPNWLCSSHKSLGRICFSEEETLLLYHLTSCQHYRELLPCSVSVDLREKVDHFFKCLLL